MSEVFTVIVLFCAAATAIACAIVKGQKYVYFEKFFYKKFKRIKEIPKGSW